MGEIVDLKRHLIDAGAQSLVYPKDDPDFDKRASEIASTTLQSYPTSAFATVRTMKEDFTERDEDGRYFFDLEGIDGVARDAIERQANSYLKRGGQEDDFDGFFYRLGVKTMLVGDYRRNELGEFIDGSVPNKTVDEMGDLFEKEQVSSHDDLMKLIGKLESGEIRVNGVGKKRIDNIRGFADMFSKAYTNPGIGENIDYGTGDTDDNDQRFYLMGYVCSTGIDGRGRFSHDFSDSSLRTPGTIPRAATPYDNPDIGPQPAPAPRQSFWTTRFGSELRSNWPWWTAAGVAVTSAALGAWHGFSGDGLDHISYKPISTDHMDSIGIAGDGNTIQTEKIETGDTGFRRR